MKYCIQNILFLIPVLGDCGSIINILRLAWVHHQQPIPVLFRKSVGVPLSRTTTQWFRWKGQGSGWNIDFLQDPANEGENRKS